MKKLDIEGHEASPEVEQNKQDENIEFSSKLVDYLSLKTKSFKKDNKPSLTLDSLKKVYCHGARLGQSQGLDGLNLYSLAWVQMFLRLKSGDRMVPQKNSLDSVKATKLELEEVPEKNIRFSTFVDISESWMPSENDFEKAKKEMEENSLDHEYDNIEDLYLEYEPIKPKWD